MIRIFGTLPNKVLGIFGTNILKISGVSTSWITQTGGITTISDNFDNYTVGNLAGQGNWLAAQNNMAIVDVSGNKQVTPVSGARSLLYRSEIFTDNHYSQITIKSIASGSFVGVVVRSTLSAGTGFGYAYYADSTQRYLKYFNVASGTTGSTIANIIGTTNAVNDVLRLEVSGSTLKCYKNGALDTGLTGGTGIFTNTAIPSGGTPGIFGYTVGSSNIDTWSGDNI